jgi:hypothetical protein
MNIRSLKINLFYIIPFLILTSNCMQKTTQKQLSESTEFEILVDLPDTVIKGEELFVTMVIKNKKYKLLNAYFDCFPKDSIEIKHNGESIKGCSKDLVVENDSVKIYFEPQIEGRQKFHTVTLLAQGIDNYYYWQNCTFEYYVK